MLAFAAGEEVFVDGQEPRTSRWMPFGKLPLEAVAEIALDGGGADAFPTTQAATVDAHELWPSRSNARAGVLRPRESAQNSDLRLTASRNRSNSPFS